MWPDVPLFPDQASTMAGDVDALYLFGVGIAIVFSLLIAGLLFFFSVRYRRKKYEDVGDRERAPEWLEILWSVVPLIITMIMFAWGLKVYVGLSRPPADAIEYFVTGKQWMWKYQHPDGYREINDFHVPVGVPIKLTMTSEDVIHSFFVPAFRTKSDVIPGRYTTVWFEATKTGAFRIFCAEYCGAEHSLMGGTLYVMEPHEYEAWLDGERPGQSMIASGAQLFESLACNTCHREETAARAPMLAGLLGSERVFADGSTTVADESYVRESILNPKARVVAGYDALMPTYQGRVTEEQLFELINYIRSIGAEGSADASEPGASPEPTSTSEG